MSESATSANYIALAAEIVSAYVSNNAVRPGELPALISDIHSALVRVAGSAAEAPAEALKPAIQAKKSIQPDYIVCLEDGKRFKSLKRHLRTVYDPHHPSEILAPWKLDVIGGLRL